MQGTRNINWGRSVTATHRRAEDKTEKKTLIIRKNEEKASFKSVIQGT